MAITACLVIAMIVPFALFASVGRGYLLPVGVAILTLIMANLVVVVGRILPLGNPHALCAGNKLPDTD